MNKKKLAGILMAVSIILFVVFIKFNRAFYTIPHGRIIGWMIGIFGLGSCLASLGLCFLNTQYKIKKKKSVKWYVDNGCELPGPSMGMFKKIYASSGGNPCKGCDFKDTCKAWSLILRE